MTCWSIEDHLQCGKDIQRIWSMHSWYIQDFHRKKCTYKMKYKPNDKADGCFYAKYLFYKKRGMTSMSTFPSEFKCAMDSLMYEQFINHPDCTNDVYYGAVGLIKYTGTPFSKQPNLSQEDKRIILAFNKEYILLMQKCIKEIEIQRPRYSSLKKMKKWCTHVESLDRWNVLRIYWNDLVKQIRHKQIVWYWFEISQRQHS